MIPFLTPLTTVRNIKPTEMSFISSNLDIDRNTRLANYKQQHGRQLYNIQMHVDAILACISISIPRTHVTCHMQQFIHHKMATFYSSQIQMASYTAYLTSMFITTLVLIGPACVNSTQTAME